MHKFSQAVPTFNFTVTELCYLGVGLLSAVARVGSILAPFIVMAGETFPGTFLRLATISIRTFFKQGDHLRFVL